MLGLETVYFFREADDGRFALFEARGQGRLDVGFFLEDEGREEGDDFFGLEVCEDVFEDQFCED